VDKSVENDKSCQLKILDLWRAIFSECLEKQGVRRNPEALTAFYSYFVSAVETDFCPRQHEDHVFE
jgi:hypothetical protein